ncbi:putative tellurite resistance protein [Azoarcus olearius]|uniref:class I SAM-dependent methyltransferase n=1 Tax=Azoarcus sp. (strain BH72) TaxID=418699 RepID=UPI0008063B89|nr:methyltransferase domain-containing protein [Azoarcus olearius]ANQ84851.1 putative tellurite resistance protein [Azoarcus olearius]
MHSSLTAPSPWVTRFAPLIAAGGEVLDLACGGGRHARWLAQRGFRVEAADRDGVALELLAGVPHVRTRQVDLEAGAWPYDGRRFDAVVVTNYLYRPRFDAMLALLGAGGVLIYETFMAGNERFGKPSNPDFLLAPHELLQRLPAGWSVVAFEQGEVAQPRPAALQRICAVNGGGLIPLP